MKFKNIYLPVYILIGLLISCGNQNKKNIDLIESKTELVTQQDTTTEEKVIERIREFYENYISENSPLPPKMLKEKFITKGMIEKLERLMFATDIDPVLHAQDISPDIMLSLEIKHIEKSWYLVSYKWARDTINISLRVNKIDDKYMIDYITPIWNDGLHGDSLLCNNPLAIKIENSDPPAFLKSFYNAYTMKYCSMPESLERQLTEIRTVWLTDNALSQFNEAVKEEQQDGRKGYDLLIDNFDFDCLWRSSIKVTKLDEGVYQVCYTRNETFTVIELEVIKKEQKYYINSIKKK